MIARLLCAPYCLSQPQQTRIFFFFWQSYRSYAVLAAKTVKLFMVNLSRTKCEFHFVYKKGKTVLQSTNEPAQYIMPHYKKTLQYKITFKARCSKNPTST